MNKLDLQIIGSLQIKRFTFRSENPLEEVWARISQLGSQNLCFTKFIVIVKIIIGILLLNILLFVFVKPVNLESHSNKPHY